MGYELYAFESYQIYDDPSYISMEASIEGDLGGTKFERDEKRLLAAVKAGDEEAAKATLERACLSRLLRTLP